MSVATETIKTKIPARMDRLPWSRWHWLVVIALGTVWILDGLEVTIKGAVGAALTETIGFSTVQVAGSASIYLLGAVSGALFWGYLTDRFGRQKLFIITLATYMVGVVGTTLAGLFEVGFITPYVWFAVFRFVTGFGIGGEYAAINSAIDELIPARVRGWVDLAINGSWWVGTAVGATLGFVFLQTLPAGMAWRVAFGLGGFLAIGILLLRFFVPESPRWLITHGYEEEAEKTVREIERDVKSSTGVSELEEPSDDEAIELRERESVGWITVGRNLFAIYPRRSIAGGGILLTQAFLYNAIFFTFGLMLTTFYGISSGVVPLFLIPFAVGNYMGPLILGRFFDTVGRKVMIPATFGLAGVLTIATGFAFWQGWFGSPWLLTAAWVVIFFFASAGASSGYLTVSETFPLELRAMAIAFFYATATAVGGIVGPFLFGNLIASETRLAVFYGYLVGGGLMLVGGLIHRIFGVEAAQKGLEAVAMPLSVKDIKEGDGEAPSYEGPGGVDVLDQDSVKSFQREHGLDADGLIGPETRGALSAARAEEGERGELSVVDVTDAEDVRSFQSRYGLPLDGVVGPLTMGAVRSLQSRFAFDPADDESVREFQTAHGLEPSGDVDLETQSALRAARQERGEEPTREYLELDPVDPDSVKRFQSACGLKTTGDVDLETQGALLAERARRRRNSGVDPADPDSIKRFQSAHGLRESGEIDGKTRKRLRRERAKIEGLEGRVKRRSLFGVDPADAESIKRFQRHHDLEVDGVIGPETRAALRRKRHLLVGVDPTDAESIRDFQSEHDLTVDGVIGPETQGTMRVLRKRHEPEGVEEEERDDYEEGEEDEEGDGHEWDPKGLIEDFDPADASAVRSFQKAHGLDPDGVIGPMTQAALRSVIHEREAEEEEGEGRPPERFVRPYRSGRPHTSGFSIAADVSGVDRDLDREIRQLLRVLDKNGSRSKKELKEESRAKLWGPGRFNYVLDVAEEEGLVRRVGRDRYSLSSRGASR